MDVRVDVRTIFGTLLVLVCIFLAFVFYDQIRPAFGSTSQVNDISTFTNQQPAANIPVDRPSIADTPVNRPSMADIPVRAELDEIMSELSGPQTQWDDPRLVNTITKYVLDPPRPYLTKFSYPLFKTAQAEAVDKLFKQKGNLFFVECGGLDGERSSNTIWLEQKRHWNGLLVEMDPSYYMQIRGKNRKCFSMNACISPHNYPITMNFKEHKMGQGKLVVGDSVNGAHQLKAHCFPFYSMMLALNRTHIDYFSLDVEGFELDILRSIPFDLLDISVFTVEYVHGKEGKDKYEEFMHSKGYITHSVIKASKAAIYYGANDFLFVKKGFKV